MTEAMIDRLQKYHGFAIHSNVGNLAQMKMSIHASLFHVASSEKNNWHDHCPKGSDSWCLYKQDKQRRQNKWDHEI